MEPSDASVRGTILVVEDDPGIRSMLELALRAAGYKVCLVAGSAEAADVLALEMIDLVLLDRHLAGEPGSTVGRYVNSIQDLPLILMSADDPPGSRRAGQAPWLQKPFTLEALYTAVEQAIPPHGRRSAPSAELGSQETSA